MCTIRLEAAEVLITLSSATIIYLVEVRSNIPSLAHAIWLAIVTMTTVGDVPLSSSGFYS